METNDRPRKKIQESGKAASRRKSAVSRGAPSGSLKGRPLADEGRTGREKPSLAAARRTSSDAEQSPSRRKDLPLPLERPDREDRREDRSLRLTLRVEGERITVVTAFERKQKVLQAQLIWLVPIIGAGLVFTVLQEEERAQGGKTPPSAIS